jgi:hypothetical protein
MSNSELQKRVPHSERLKCEAPILPTPLNPPVHDDITNSNSDSEILSSMKYVMDDTEFDMNQDISVSINFARQIFQATKNALYNMSKIDDHNKNSFYVENGLCE